jgi:hypothetical protein
MELARPRPMTEQLLTVGQVADQLQVSRWFVYDHGDELGLVKIGGRNRYQAERVAKLHRKPRAGAGPYQRRLA